MALVIKIPDEVEVALGQEATFGTALADDADFNNTTPEFGHQIKVANPVVEMDVKIRDDDAARGKRYIDVEDLNRDWIGSNPKLKIPEHFVRKDELGLLLYSHFQAVTEGSDPFQKVFIYHATQPDFTANAGCFMTGIVKMPVASNSFKFKSMVCPTFTLKATPSGVLTISSDLMGKGPVVLDCNPSGTWLIADDDFFYFESPAAYTYDFSGAVSPGVGEWELTPSMVVTPIGQSSGECQSYGLSKYGGTFKGSFQWNGTTQDFFTNLPLGTAVTITITYGSDGVDGYLNFVIHGVLEAVDLNYGDTLMIDATVKIAGDVSGSIQPLTITLADAVDKGW